MANSIGSFGATTPIDTPLRVTGAVPGQIWALELDVRATTLGNGGARFAINTPGGSAFGGAIYGPVTAPADVQSEFLSSDGVLSALAFGQNTGGNISTQVRIHVSVFVSTPGDIVLQFASATPGENTLVRGHMRAALSTPV